MEFLDRIDHLLFILQLVSHLSHSTLVFFNGVTISMLFAGHRNSKVAAVSFYITALNTCYIFVSLYLKYLSPGIEFTVFDWLSMVEAPITTLLLFLWGKPYVFFWR